MELDFAREEDSMNAKMYLGGAISLLLLFAAGSASAVDFSDRNSIFDIAPITNPTAGPLTQSVTATFDANLFTEKFFKAVIESPVSEETEEPEPEYPPEEQE